MRRIVRGIRMRLRVPHIASMRRRNSHLHEGERRKMHYCAENSSPSLRPRLTAAPVARVARSSVATVRVRPATVERERGVHVAVRDHCPPVPPRHHHAGEGKVRSVRDLRCSSSGSRETVEPLLPLCNSDTRARADNLRGLSLTVA